MTSRLINLSIFLAIISLTWTQTEEKHPEIDPEIDTSTSNEPHPTVDGDPLPLLPWPEGKTWTDTGTSLRLWRYIHHDWIGGAEVTECSQNGIPMKVEHIYYWPGDHVSLTCKVCRRGLDTNGKMKSWGWASKAYSFFEFYHQNKRLEYRNIGDQFQQITSDFAYADREPFLMPGSQVYSTLYGHLPKSLRIQKFEQIGTTLHIHNMEARGAGVYFCYDDTAMNLARHFYVLHAMTPINRVNWMSERLENRVQLSPDMGMMVCKSPNFHDKTTSKYQCGDDCGKPIYMYPDTQWKFNWRPIVYKPEKDSLCDSGDTKCEKYLKLHRNTSNLAIRRVPEKPIHLHVFKKRSLTDQFYTNVALAFQWEPWSECKPGRTHQRREGHCVLQLADGKKRTNPDNKYHDVTKWMKRLDSIFLLGGNTTGFVRLHSSTLMTMIMDYPVTTDCGTKDRSKSVQLINDFYEQVVFPTLNIPGDQLKRDKFTLNNEWRACFKYTHSGENEGKDGSYSDIIGTYVIETKKCPT